MPAFQVAGGVLLFLQALTLTFSNPGLSSITAAQHEMRKAPVISRYFRWRFR